MVRFTPTASDARRFVERVKLFACRQTDGEHRSRLERERFVQLEQRYIVLEFKTRNSSNNPSVIAESLYAQRSTK